MRHTHSLVYRGAISNSVLTKSLLRHLCNTVRVSEDNTNLGWSQTLLGQLEDLVLDLVTGDLQPLRNRPREWKLALTLEILVSVIAHLL